MTAAEPDADADAEAPIRAFAPYTDPTRALGLLQGSRAELFGRPVTLTSCAVMDSSYKTYTKRSSWPKSVLSVCYRLGLAEQADNAIFYAKLYLQGRSHVEWQRLGPPPAAASGAAPPVIHLPALGMIAWRFPHDPAMPHLAEAMLPQRVRHHLPYHALPPGLDGPADLTHLSAEPLKYNPENGCTLRYRLQWGGAGARVPAQELIVFGKVYRDDRGRAACERMQHYWRTTAFKSCRPLGYDETIRTVWSLGVQGLPLAQVISRANHASCLGQVGCGLAAVHASDPAVLGMPDSVAVAELLADFIKKIDKLSRACPPCAAPLAGLLAPARRVGERLAAGAHAGRALHGDFHIGQMLAHDGEVYLFDFDSFTLGDPEQDLAEFIVALLFQGFEPNFVHAMARALVRSYCARSRWTLRLEYLHWYALVEYVTRAYRFYRQQRPGWQHALQQSVSNLAVLEAVLEGLDSQSAQPPRITSPTAGSA